MIRFLLLGATLLAAAPAAFAPAAFAQVVTTDAAKVAATSFAVEPSHTRVVFTVSHLGFTTWYGDLTGASGTLSFDGKNPAKSALDITVPTASISTTNTKLDGELKSPMWLDAAQYPAITFKSTRITLGGHDTGKITGDLTLHGVTRPVTLTAHFNGGGTNPLDHNYTIGFDATGQIKRSDFGVKTYLPLIGDVVSLSLSAAFEAK